MAAVADRAYSSSNVRPLYGPYDDCISMRGLDDGAAAADAAAADGAAAAVAVDGVEDDGLASMRMPIGAGTMTLIDDIQP